MGKPSYSGGVFAPWDGSFTLDTFSIMSISPSTALGMRRETSSSWGSRAAVPNLLALRFVKMVFPWTGVGGWFWDDSSTLYLFCTLFLLLLHQLHLRSLGIRSWSLSTPDLEQCCLPSWVWFVNICLSFFVLCSCIAVICLIIPSLPAFCFFLFEVYSVLID